MSVEAGAVIVKDPDASLVYIFDWHRWLGAAAQIGTSEFRIVNGPDAVLKLDTPTIIEDGRAAQVRLTGGTLGKDYLVAHRVVTTETPPQDDERAITIRVRHVVP